MTAVLLPPGGTAYDWDSEVRRHTSNFHVDGTTIVIQIGDGPHPRTFKVGKYASDIRIAQSNYCP